VFTLGLLKNTPNLPGHNKSEEIVLSFRYRHMDNFIGWMRISLVVLAAILYFMVKDNKALWFTYWPFVLIYASLWLLLSKKSSTLINKFAYIFLVSDLTLIGLGSFMTRDFLTVYSSVYIIPLMIFLLRFGVKVASLYVVIASLELLFIQGFKWDATRDAFTHLVTAGVMIAITVFTGRVIGIERLIREKLLYLSIRDGLTGLYNFRFFNELLISEIKRSRRFKYTFALVIMDVDHFKVFNDRFGHHAGNLVLEKLARILTESLREADFLARYGGEEFCFILPRTSRAKAIEIVERIRLKISQESFQGHRVTASFGIASYPEDATNGIALIKKADAALYKAKREGRNRVVSEVPNSKADG
jgi:diguanylate cyclase (GGDEF)-like protein